MEKSQISPNVKIWQLGLGFANTSVIYALIKSGVIEQLRDTPKSLEQLSDNNMLNRDVLFRVLRFAVAIDVVGITDNQYFLTEAGRLLLKDVPGSLCGGLMLMGNEPWQKSWNNLFHSLTTGKAAFDKAMGSPFFEYLNTHPEYGEPYNSWMTKITMMSVKAICEAYDFSPYKTICDIGGGQGLLLKGILTDNPDMKGILFDQESVVKDHLLVELADRVEIKSGNFFESVPSADLLIMKSIIHDWDDNRSSQILKSCRKAMNEKSRLLLVEMVIAGNSDMVGLFYDLHMQVMLSGRERTEVEFRELLQTTELKLNRIIPTKSPMKIIEAVK